MCERLTLITITHYVTRPVAFFLEGLSCVAHQPLPPETSICMNPRSPSGTVTLGQDLRTKSYPWRAPVINALSVAPQRVMGDVLWQEWFDLFPESVGDEKVLADAWLFGIGS
jgi:hypothetical protein